MMMNMMMNMMNMMMIAFIERFEDKWYWRSLSQKAIDYLPKLSLEDIDEVMSYHVKKTSIA